MLARRFTIVCLLLTLFSMFFASLVAQAGRTERSWERAGRACVLNSSPACRSDR